MAGVTGRGVLLLLIYILGSKLTAEAAAPEAVLDEKISSLTCGPRRLEFVLHPRASNVSFTVSARDQKGLAHALQNEPDCGTWVSHRPDGSVVIGTDYTGCYVSEEDEEYVLTLEIEAAFATQTVTLEKQLKCPVLPAMDAPRPALCTTIAGKDRLLCGSLPVTRTVCEELNCCYDPTDVANTCYFGNPVTAQCTPDGLVTIALSADVVVPPLNLSTVRLLTVSSSCPQLNVYQNEAFLFYRFPLSCSAYKVIGDSTVYENRLDALNSVVTWNAASISRDSFFRLTVRCTFSSSSSLVPLQVEVFTLPPPPPVSSPGPLSLEMRLAKDQTYSAYYTALEYPVLKVLRDPIFVEVRLLQRTDPNLVLVLNECWATPSSNPRQQPQWPILVAGCPYAGDNYLTQMFKIAVFSALQFPSYYQRFAVSTFTFVGVNQQNLAGQVFFHCSASVCVPSVQRSCTPSCQSRKKRMVEDFGTKYVNIVTEGPVYFDIQEGELAGSHSTSAEPLAPGWVRAAVFAVGFLVLLAVACLALVQFVRLSKSNHKCRMAVLKA